MIASFFGKRFQTGFRVEIAFVDALARFVLDLNFVLSVLFCDGDFTFLVIDFQNTLRSEDRDRKSWANRDCGRLAL